MKNESKTDPRRRAATATDTNTLVALAGVANSASGAEKHCWICGGPPDSGEHKTKRSDLKAAFGQPTQTQPLFFHDRNKKNRPVGSLNAKLLKSPDRICHFCNTTRTQPHDRAWETLSKFFRENPAIVPGSTVRFNRAFPYETRQHMLNVHLFFVKVFGCLVLEGALRIDIAGFSDAILQGRAHPLIHLKFGRPSAEDRIMVGRSDIWIWPSTAEAPTKFATWFYSLPHIWVSVMFAMSGERRDGLVGSWHPGGGSKSLLIADFRYADELRLADENTK